MALGMRRGGRPELRKDRSPWVFTMLAHGDSEFHIVPHSSCRTGGSYGETCYFRSGGFCAPPPEASTLRPVGRQKTLQPYPANLHVLDAAPEVRTYCWSTF